VVGDGGFAMLMAELTTAVANKLPVKIILLKNNSLAEVKFEQREIGNQEYGCTLAPIDFVAFAKACGADGFHCERPEEVRSAIQSALASRAWPLSKRLLMPTKSRRNPQNSRLEGTIDVRAARFPSAGNAGIASCDRVKRWL
jgi:pyruvate dehydrogenase (quinone)